MMNPQYLPPGQNNNAPNNPLGFPPTSQEYNGAQNANMYGQMSTNGPHMAPKPFDQNDMAQKMQSMNINNGPGFPNIPSSQLPPGQLPPGANFPPTSNFGPSQLQGQRPQGPFPSGHPPASGAPQMPQQMQRPPSSTPGPAPSQPGLGPMPPSNQNQFQMPPASMSQGLPPMSQGPPTSMSQGPPTSMSQGPPTSMSQGPPTSMSQGPPPTMSQGPPTSMPQGPPPMSQASQQPPGQPPQMAPHSQSGLPSNSGPMGRQAGMPPGQSKPGFQHPGLPPQPGQSPQQSLPSHMGPSQPGQPGLPSGPPGHNSQPSQMHPPRLEPSGQPGFPPTSQPGFNQPGLPGQPGIPPQSGLSQPGMLSQPGLPPQPGMPPQPRIPQQPGLLPHPGMAQQPGLISQPRMPPQPGLPSQSNMPPHPGMGQQPGVHQQPGLLSQPGLPPQPNIPLHPAMGQQPGFPQQPGLQQPGSLSQPGFPPQPNIPQQPGLPPQPGMPLQPGMPPQPGMPQQPGLSSQPGMPPQQFQSMPGLPHMPPPLNQHNQYGGMPPVSQPGFSPGYPQSGYPPQPPFPGQQPSYPGQQFQQPPQKRLDPDNMPSPIQVMADDQQNRGGIFVTNEKGLVPPLVTTDFVVDDKGNASPRYIRSSMYSVPVTADLLKQTSMPFCLVISPMAETVGSELEPPLLDFSALTNSMSMGPVRCSRCKAYMCPNMKFIDAGRHFKCAFCKATTEVPMEYTQYVNSMQQYGRVPAEMALGTYEIVATKEYCRNNTLPNPPAVVFVLDVSYNAIKNGLVQTVCDNIMSFIEELPKDPQTGQSWTRVGFITYSSTVHFYNIKGTLAQPQMLSVGDVGDMFVPLLEGFLVRAEDSGPVLQQLLQQLPAMFCDNKETETILLPAVQAGLEALKAADTSGQLLVFHTSLPTFNAPGKLVNRDERKLLGTDKEKQVLAPQTTAYNELGQTCAGAGVAVELFVCNNSYVDTATIGQLPRLTGGQTHKYTYFTAEVDGARLAWDVRRVLARPTAHDAVMRVRASSGVRATDFYGHLFMANTTDVELAAIDADKAIGIEIKHDDKLTGEEGVFIQAALLYTHRSGQRRLRIINLALAVAHQLADAYRSMELDTCIAFLTKQAVWQAREHGGRGAREALSSRCARSLAAYRRHCASPSAAGQLVLPEAMKLLPLYTSCLLRADALAGGPDITCDDRSCAMYRSLTADVQQSVVYTYPRLLPLTLLPRAAPPLRASADKLHDTGVYLLENGVHMLMWVGSQAPSEFVRDVFGVAAATQVDTQVAELPTLDNETSQAVRALVEDARVKRKNAMRLTIMRQHDKLEAVLRHFLVEDRGVDGSASYVDYLCHIHKEIRSLL